MKKLFCTAASILLAAMLVVGGATAFADETALSAKTYVPEKADFLDYWGGVGDIDAEDGDGITTFAHASFLVPLKGDDIEMNTSFKLLSKKSTAEGGDGVDGWVTYSFAATPGVEGKDNSFPYATGTVPGVYLHITNYSGTTAPNCVEIVIIQFDGTNRTEIAKSFVDNALGVRFTFNLTKGEDGKFDLTFTPLDEDKTINMSVFSDMALDESLFINENGQTYFSTAIYEGAGCDGEHWKHRDLSVYSAQIYTKDATGAQVALAQDSYEYEEGKTYKPAVKVTLNGVELEEDADFFVTYTNNQKVGTAKAIIAFINAYAGNPSIEKTFTITEKKPVDPAPPSGGDTGDDVKPDNKGGCGGSIAAGSLLLGGGAVAAAVAIVRKKKI